MNKRVVILAGGSGSGKSYIEKQLIEQFPDEFHKLHQITTRSMREDEVQGYPYTFVTHDEYEQVKDTLIGRTEVNGNYYGTIFDLDDKKINTVILNKAGIEDFISMYPRDNCDIDYIVVMIDSRKPVTRVDRDEEYVMNERWDTMEVMDMCFVHNPPQYVSAIEIRNRIVKFFERYYATNNHISQM